MFVFVEPPEASAISRVDFEKYRALVRALWICVFACAFALF